MHSNLRTTLVRIAILTLTVVVAVLLYLDRFCLSFVVTYIREDLRLTSGQTGFLLGSFFLTYAFGQIPGGWLSDRFGARTMLAFYLATWSILTGLMGLATTFVALLLFRFGCGLFEAGAYPACAGIIRAWVPYRLRGLASGVVSIGGRIGGAISPAMTAYLMVVFMPVETSSLVTPSDILKPRQLARDTLGLTDEGKKIPPHIERAVKQLQDKLKLGAEPRLRTVAELSPEADATRPASKNQATSEQTFMAEVVNEWLKTTNLLADVDSKPFLPKLSKQAIELLDRKPADRTLDETIRLNRLMLELLFPESIRKLYGDSWQPVLMIYGGVGVLVAILFFGFYRDSPRDHFLIDGTNPEFSEAQEKANAEPVMPAGQLWRGILTNVGLWASSIVQFGTNFGWIFPASLLPLYLTEVHQVPEEERGLMSSLPFLISLPMMIVGGLWTDVMAAWFGIRIGRCFPVASTRFVTGALFIVCWMLNAPWPIVIVLCLLSVINDMGIPSLWAYNLDVGKANVGLILGWGNMWGNLGAFVSPIVLLWLRDQFADKKAGYDAIFLTCAGVFFFIGFASLFIDATKPIGGIAPETPPAPPTGPTDTPGPEAIRAGEPPMRSTEQN